MTPTDPGQQGPLVEPVPGAPAAVATLHDERALVIADYHAGYEAGLRIERGVDVPSKAESRRERLLSLLERTSVGRLIVCGDLMHSIGDPGGAERGELEVLFESLPSKLSVTLVKGNHDGAIGAWLEGCEIVPGSGTRVADVGVCHGHTWPAREVLESRVVCLGHEHPCVRLEDEVGGSRVEPAWLRGRLEPAAFRGRDEYAGLEWLEGDPARTGSRPVESPAIVVLPAFNELVGGTWINVAGQSFLAPFLPAGIARGEAYLLDGTRLGPYRSV
ncbi:metallophosphoesterase [Natrononativus amylolyticus]|uniref:metallophosphoesterase n=1 Tax=Natrononativus amylolyticus TaxID=2963434 RepID=UPI0020CFDC03|nr:metallophosphoesterase [Natrononativus amylolyticus]